jgi:prophage regulatory protein
VAQQAFYRLAEIVGDKKRGIDPQIPVSRATFWNWVRDGKAPAPVKLGPNTTAWRGDEIRTFIEHLGSAK